MKFAIGYQLSEPDEEPFLELVRDYREHIAEVYFPWADMPSGRAALASRRGYTDWTAQARLEEDLSCLRELGVRLDLLFNANCYGGRALSKHLENQVCSLLDHLGERVGGADTITTTSLAVARTVKKHYPKVDVRASVNMRIGTVQAMEYVAGLFDSFCVQRDFNRDIGHIRDLKSWADARGKRLSLLANSGCLRLCPGQIFHDNTVAHEQDIDETDNIEGWMPHVCWNLYKDRSRWPAILQATWVRPEDLHRYEGLVEVAKLATRMHARPRLVIQAYAEGKHRGNLLDLLEPGFSPAFQPFAIRNDAFPPDWFERTSTCDRRCERCGYCAATLKAVLQDMSQPPAQG